MDQATADEQHHQMLLMMAVLERVDARLARLEDILSCYEPLLAEAARRMSGPMKWRR